MKPDRAPVALFVYRRPEHTARTLSSLAANRGAEETDVIVFADGARGQADAEGVASVRAVVGSMHGRFRSLEIVVRPSNLGLAANIVDGVGAVMDRAGRAIVLEDDIETAPGFLDYMNAALTRYRDDARLWHVSGWTPAIDPAGLAPFFSWTVMNCWGWASWADRWAHYRREPDRILREWSADDRRRFDLDGAHDFFAQIEDNAAGRITTWAVFWYATIFEAGGLCLTPTVPFVRNIGLDGTGEHCRPERGASLMHREFGGGLPSDVALDREAVARVCARLAGPLHLRLRRRVRRALLNLRGDRTSRPVPDGATVSPRRVS